MLLLVRVLRQNGRQDRHLLGLARIASHFSSSHHSDSINFVLCSFFGLFKHRRFHICVQVAWLFGHDINDAFCIEAELLMRVKVIDARRVVLLLIVRRDFRLARFIGAPRVWCSHEAAPMA